MNAENKTSELANAPAVVQQRVVGPTAREIYKETTRNLRYIKSLRRIGASNYEISKALGIDESDPVLHK